MLSIFDNLYNGKGLPIRLILTGRQFIEDRQAIRLPENISPSAVYTLQDPLDSRQIKAVNDIGMISFTSVF